MMTSCRTRAVSVTPSQCAKPFQNAFLAGIFTDAEVHAIPTVSACQMKTPCRLVVDVRPRTTDTGTVSEPPPTTEGTHDATGGEERPCMGRGDGRKKQK